MTGDTRLLAGWRGRWAHAAWPYGLAALSGLLLAGSMPGTAVPGAWILLLVPLFGALDALGARFPDTRWKRWLHGFAACWLMGGVWAICTGDWLVNTMHVYGHLPLPVSHVLNLFGHGLLVGAEFFLVVGVPLLVVRRRPLLALWVVPLWCVGMQAHLVRLFFWSWGQFMYPVPALVQIADVVGTSGLSLLFIPLQWVLYASVRQALRRPWVPRREWIAACCGVGVLLIGIGGYGVWRMADVRAAQAEAPTARVVAVQPNFSLRHLASNPELSPSERQMSLGTLLADSDRALQASPPPEPGTPVVVAWPESVFPVAYRFHEQARQAVERWVRDRGVHLVLATVDFDDVPPEPGAERRVYGAAMHVKPTAAPPAVYHKIVLMPWGEYIPFADVLPFYGDLIRAWIPQIGEFTAGTEYTVFEIDDGVRVAPMICYDGTRTGIARGMTAAGANLGFVLANLAWFGPTSASLQFEHVIRFRAIENRLPLLFISQNGRTIQYDALGEALADPLPHFETGSLALDVPLRAVEAVYSHHGVWIDRVFLLLGIAAMVAGIWLCRPGKP